MGKKKEEREGEGAGERKEGRKEGRKIHVVTKISALFSLAWKYSEETDIPVCFVRSQTKAKDYEMGLTETMN